MEQIEIEWEYHIPFGVEHGVVRVDCRFIFGWISDFHIHVAAEAYITWDGARLLIGEDFNFSAFGHADARMGGTQVNTDPCAVGATSLSE